MPYVTEVARYGYQKLRISDFHMSIEMYLKGKCTKTISKQVIPSVKSCAHFFKVKTRKFKSDKVSFQMLKCLQ